MAEDVVPVMWYVACCRFRPCGSVPLVGLVVGSNMLILSHLLVLTTFFLSLQFQRPKGARQLLHLACEAVPCCRFTDNRCVFASDSVVVVIVVIVVAVVITSAVVAAAAAAVVAVGVPS